MSLSTFRRSYSGNLFPFFRMMIAQALGLTKLLVIVLFMMSANPFRFINAPTPAIWTWLLNNKV